MSAKSEQLEQELEEAAEVCASCGIAGVDNVKLKACDGGCDLVKYCSDECQENQREQHDEECKKRKAELHDKQLFTQPDRSHRGECPICCLPLPVEFRKSSMMPCCSKWICKGCDHANQKREFFEGLEPRCAFCREPAAKSREEALKQIMRRVKKNDPVAMTQMGRIVSSEKDYDKALEYWTKAAELGDVEALLYLGILYNDEMNYGVEKDEKKAVHYYEQAAIVGHHGANGYLAFHEERYGRFERAAKHFIIAANLGCNISLKEIKRLFMGGKVSKEEYAAALRGHQAAVDATKSAERDEAEAFFAAAATK